MTTATGTLTAGNTAHGDAAGNLGSVLLFLVAPFAGLAYVVGYGLIGTAAIFCYGLKAFGVRCGMFRD